jgi:hypothetical protein
VRHEIGGDVAAGAAAVLDDELLAQSLGERLREHARGDVARGARTEADDDAHRPRRVALRLGEPNGERGSAGCELEKSTACKSHGVRSLKSGWPSDAFCLEYWIAGRDLPRGVYLCLGSRRKRYILKGTAETLVVAVREVAQGYALSLSLLKIECTAVRPR